MKFFLDTANLDEIEDALETGLISGITTNPSLMAKEPKTNFYTHILVIDADLQHDPLKINDFIKPIEIDHIDFEPK